MAFHYDANKVVPNSMHNTKLPEMATLCVVSGFLLVKVCALAACSPCTWKSVVYYFNCYIIHFVRLNKKMLTKIANWQLKHCKIEICPENCQNLSINQDHTYQPGKTFSLTALTVLFPNLLETTASTPHGMKSQSV